MTIIDSPLEYMWGGVRIPYDAKIQGLLDEIAHLEETRRDRFSELTAYLTYQASQRQPYHAMDPARKHP